MRDMVKLKEINGTYYFMSIIEDEIGDINLLQ